MHRGMLQQRKQAEEEEHAAEQGSAAEEGAVAAVRRAVEGLEALKGETTLSLNDAVRRMVEFQAEHARSCAGYAQQGVFEKCNSFAAPPRGGRGGGGAGAPPRQAAGSAPT